MLVGVTVFVGVPVCVGVVDGVAVLVLDGVGVFVDVLDGVGVEVLDGVGVFEDVGVFVGVFVGVDVGVGVGDGDGPPSFIAFKKFSPSEPKVLVKKPTCQGYITDVSDDCHEAKRSKSIE